MSSGHVIRADVFFTLGCHGHGASTWPCEDVQSVSQPHGHVGDSVTVAPVPLIQKAKTVDTSSGMASHRPMRYSFRLSVSRPT